LDTGTLSVKKIFGQDRRHVVPLFQRPYVWQRDKQWEPFWEDIRKLAEKLRRGEKPRPHFLGAIVLDQMPKPTGQVETRLVIDGQQRLTTLQIFLEAFCDLCAERGLEKHHKALLKLTRNDDPMSEDENEVFKVWPTNVDQEHFCGVMRCESPDELRKKYGVKEGNEVGHAIADGYLYFYAAIGEWFSCQPDGQAEALDALFDAARDYVRLVVIDLDKEDDAQLIFETLNARGTPLLPSDLVKNFLFHRAHFTEQPLEKLYADYWRFFDEDTSYWRRELGRGHARRHCIDIYLQHYLTLQKRDEVPVAHLYVVFREFAGQNADARELLASIKRYADVYRSFDEFVPGSREGRFFDWVGALDITTAYPPLMELFARYGDDTATVHPILDDIESFLVRRMICQLSTRGYNRLFLDLLRELMKESGTPAERVREFLLSSTAESNRWPKDAEFQEAWINQPVYQRLVQRRVRMILEALERRLRTSKSEKIALEEKLTVEHLLPQEWRKHWPLPDGADEAAEQRRERILHTLGNLTLLNRKLNPAVSNSAWKKKRPELLKHSLLRLNHELTYFSEWDEQCIENRSRQLFEVARSIWTHPTDSRLPQKTG
jgi:hypothetical protein